MQDLDPEVLAFRANFESRSPLDELVREGARRMLQAAIDAEVDEFIAAHSQRCDEQGRRLVVGNGHLLSREILSGAGPLEVQNRLYETILQRKRTVSSFHRVTCLLISRNPRQSKS